MKESFSERNGFVTPMFQVDSLLDRTRNRLWDIISLDLLDVFGYSAFHLDRYADENTVNDHRVARSFLVKIHSKYFGLSVEDFPEEEDT